MGTDTGHAIGYGTTVLEFRMCAAISIGYLLAVLVTLNLIGLCIAAYVVMRRK